MATRMGSFMMASSISEFERFNFNTEQTSLGIQWTRWINRLQNLFRALNVGDEKRQKALLLHYGGGGELMVLCETVLAATDDTFALVKVKLHSYFESKINTTFETYVFRCMKQEDDETLDQFSTRLKSAANRSSFPDSTREVKDQIVMNCLP